MNELVLAKRPLKSLLSFLSLFIDVDHAEGCGLVGPSLVLNGEDHHFVTREAVTLLLGHLQYQGDQLIHVLL